LSKAVELDDKIAKYHNELGSAYREAGKQGPADKSFKNFTRANEEFDRAFELDPNFLAALFNRSLVLQELLPRKAKESWELYLQKDPSSNWAQEARKKLEELQTQPSGMKKKDEILDDFLTAYKNKDRAMKWKILSETKGLLGSKPVAEQLSILYLQARQRRDELKAKEHIEALNDIGDLEKAKNDLFFTELANFYLAVDDSKIGVLLDAKNVLAEGRQINGSNTQDAIKLFERSKAMFLAAGDPWDAALAEFQTASSLRYVGRVAEGIARLDSLIAAAEKMKHKILLPALYYNKSNTLLEQDQFSAALQDAFTSLKKAEEIDDQYHIRGSAETIVTIYSTLNEPEKSLNYIGKFLSNQKPYYSDPNQICRGLIVFSNVMTKLDLKSAAVDFAGESYYRSQEDAAESDILNGSLGELTKALANKGLFEKALEAADRSNQIASARKQSPANDKTVASTFQIRADLKYQMKNCAGALQDYDKSLAFYGKAPEVTYNLYTLHKGKLLCFQKLEKQTEFNDELGKVLQLSEEYRQKIREDDSRQGFFENEQMVFDAAIMTTGKHSIWPKLPRRAPCWISSSQTNPSPRSRKNSLPSPSRSRLRKFRRGFRKICW
jgi:tetratricopeptide (TPR) repeat protein